MPAKKGGGKKKASDEPPGTIPGRLKKKESTTLNIAAKTVSIDEDMSDEDLRERLINCLERMSLPDLSAVPPWKPTIKEAVYDEFVGPIPQPDTTSFMSDEEDPEVQRLLAYLSMDPIPNNVCWLDNRSKHIRNNIRSLNVRRKRKGKTLGPCMYTYKPTWTVEHWSYLKLPTALDLVSRAFEIDKRVKLARKYRIAEIQSKREILQDEVEAKSTYSKHGLKEHWLLADGDMYDSANDTKVSNDTVDCLELAKLQNEERAALAVHEAVDSERYKNWWSGFTQHIDHRKHMTGLQEFFASTGIPHTDDSKYLKYWRAQSNASEQMRMAKYWTSTNYGPRKNIVWSVEDKKKGISKPYLIKGKHSKATASFEDRDQLRYQCWLAQNSPELYNLYGSKLPLEKAECKLSGKLWSVELPVANHTMYRDVEYFNRMLVAHSMNKRIDKLRTLTVLPAINSDHYYPLALVPGPEGEPYGEWDKQEKINLIRKENLSYSKSDPNKGKSFPNLGFPIAAPRSYEHLAKKVVERIMAIEEVKDVIQQEFKEHTDTMVGYLSSEFSVAMEDLTDFCRKEIAHIAHDAVRSISETSTKVHKPPLEGIKLIDDKYYVSSSGVILPNYLFGYDPLSKLIQA